MTRERRPSKRAKTSTGKRQLVSDPRVFGDDWPRRPDTMKLAIGLDLGTMTGYSATYFDPAVPLQRPLVLMQGQLDLRLGDYDSRGLLGVRLRAFMNRVVPDIVFMERVRFTPSTPGNVTPGAVMARAYTAAEFFGGLMLVLSDWAYVTDTPLSAISIGTIKKRATGKGNANKLQVVEAHNREFGTEYPLDEHKVTAAGIDNICDSAWALIVGLENYAEGLNVAN